jgi:hypothetical protein
MRRRAADAGLNVGGGKSESRECAEWNDTPVPQGLGRADGGRVVVTVCDEPLARGGGAVERGWPGLVWCKSGLPASISRWLGLLLVGWRVADVVTELPQAVRNMVGRRGIR